MLSFEKICDMNAYWTPETTTIDRFADVGGKEVRPLTPHMIRKEMTEHDLRSLGSWGSPQGPQRGDWARHLWALDALCHADTKDEKILLLSQWAVSYHKAVNVQEYLIDELHADARRYHEALVHLRDLFAVLQDNTAGCQHVKVSICNLESYFIYFWLKIKI